MKPESEAARRRRQAQERRDLIAFLGMKPESGTAEDRYAATTGELAMWAREKTGGEMPRKNSRRRRNWTVVNGRRKRRRRNPGYEGRKARRLRELLIRIGATRSGWGGAGSKRERAWIARKTREFIALRRRR
jgi:hypothetical protein